MSSTDSAFAECQRGTKQQEDGGTGNSQTPAYKILAMLPVRRPRRLLVFLLPFVEALALMMGSQIGIQTPMTGSQPGSIADYTPTINQRDFGMRLLECLSFQHCPWISTRPSPTRFQTLAEDQQYLDAQQRDLPRLSQPYHDIRHWSHTKRTRTLQGLEWLISHYDERWPAEEGIKHARRFNREVFTQLHACVERSLLVSQLGGGTEPKGSREATECSPERMTVILLGSANFGRARLGKVSGEQIWARSMMDTFEKLGYSLVYAYGNTEQQEIYTAIPDLVQLLIVDAEHAMKCMKHGRREWSQVLSESKIQKGALITHVQAQGEGHHQSHNYTLAEWTELESDHPNERWSSTIYFGHPPFPDQPSLAIEEETNVQKWACAQTPDFPQGTPLWKMFAMHFCDTSNEHPLGALWTLAPEPFSTFPRLSHREEHNLYMGYSIAAYCQEPVPASERRHQAYILAKQPSYFSPPSFGFSNHVFDDIKEDLDITFIAGTGEPGAALSDRGITNLGMMNATTFRDVLGHSKALIGIGRPVLSPSPYDALCMGVPFINSVTSWDKENPDDESKWASQHDGLLNVGEPYVYLVKQGDEDGLKEALEKATENPIGRFIPDRMTERAVEARYRMLVETDWEGIYREKFRDLPISG